MAFGESETIARDTLLDENALAALCEDGQVAEFVPVEGYGMVVLRGVDLATRDGRTLRVVEVSDGDAARHHRGLLAASSVTSGEPLVIRNSGGKHRTRVLRDMRPRITPGEEFVERIRSGYSNKRLY